MWKSARVKTQRAFYFRPFSISTPCYQLYCCRFNDYPGCQLPVSTRTAFNKLPIKMAVELPMDQIAVLRKAFDGFDREHSGSISTDMVAEILRLMGQPFNKRILDDMIEEVDADKSGRLEFDEFVTLAAKFIVEEDAEAMQKELREAFRLYDKDGNGYIPTSCLKEILRELDDQLTDDELEGMIDEIDADGSGTVDFDEFMEMMTGE